jgi:hemerythrin
MALLSWSDQYLIGNELIDAEHAELFRLINDFHSQWVEARKQLAIARVLNQLITYAEMHFRHEETIMGEAGFPLLAEHAALHETMVETIFQLQKSYEEGSLRLEMDTMKFVKSWLLEHILQNDYRFRDFLVRKKSLPDEAGH